MKVLPDKRIHIFIYLNTFLLLALWAGIITAIITVTKTIDINQMITEISNAFADVGELTDKADKNINQMAKHVVDMKIQVIGMTAKMDQMAAGLGF